MYKLNEIMGFGGILNIDCSENQLEKEYKYNFDNIKNNLWLFFIELLLFFPLPNILSFYIVISCYIICKFYLAFVIGTELSKLFSYNAILKSWLLRKKSIEDFNNMSNKELKIQTDCFTFRLGDEITFLQSIANDYVIVSGYNFNKRMSKYFGELEYNITAVTSSYRLT